MARLTVTRCICHDRSFEELKSYARQRDISRVEELQDRKLCSCSCRMCKPYVERMLETGQTEFKPGEVYGRN